MAVLEEVPGAPDPEDAEAVVGRRRWRVVRPRSVEAVARRGRHRGADPAASGPRPGVARVAADAGVATAEYAIATLAAVGFAGLLVVILKSDEVRGLLTGIVRQALTL